MCFPPKFCLLPSSRLFFTLLSLAGLAMFGLRKRSSTPAVEGFQVRSGGELLGEHESHLRNIQRLCGVPERHWRTLYLDAMVAYANYVQRLPASESHHHPGPGGLLSHTLEALTHALRIRRGHLLPQGADAEEITAKQDLWSYAVFSTTLLHDIGKPLMDQCVTLFDAGGKRIGLWDGLAPMQAGLWYRVRFRPDRVHRLHERAALLLAQRIIPEPALAWLVSDPHVTAVWLACICGDHDEAGVLGEITQQADTLSVAASLGAPASSAPLPGARIPLYEKLLTGLRYLLKEGSIPLNRSGAGAWFDGEWLWLVSKRGIDTLREHLTQEGHSGIPSRNDRIFDELQQFGITLANGERSIWKATVTGEGWSHTLTFLRFPASRLWPDGHTRPEPFSGTIIPVDEATECDEPAEASPAILPQHEAAMETIPATHIPEKNEHDDSGEHASSPSTTEDQASGAGEQFFAWLTEGLKESRFELNAASARLHRVTEGLLLVSPGLFKDYDAVEWHHVQKRFQKLKHHRKTAQGTNIYTYQVMGKRNKSRVKGFLIELPNAHLDGIDLPPPNPHLTLLEGE